MFADTSLSARLEALSADEMRRFFHTARSLDPCGDVALLEVAGGVAVYLGSESPVNQAVGIGMAGKVSSADVASLEAFYTEKGQRGLVVVSPLAHHSLIARLSERGWLLDGFENVLVRPYDGRERFVSVPGVDIVEVDDDELRAVWANVASVAFAAPLYPPPAQIELARIVAARAHARLFLAFVDGQPAGTGELYADDGVAWLSADATLPHYRKRGVQQALQARRLEVGAELGCELAVSESEPGSVSQRNMERYGFRVAYTRADLLAPERSTS